MAELEKVRRVITKQMPDAPHETLMTVDATTGQNGVRQAKLFGEAVGVTGIVLTKLDGTAKGGIALAIANELEHPGEADRDRRAARGPAPVRRRRVLPRAADVTERATALDERDGAAGAKPPAGLVLDAPRRRRRGRDGDRGPGRRRRRVRARLDHQGGHRPAARRRGGPRRGRARRAARGVPARRAPARPDHARGAGDAHRRAAAAAARLPAPPRDPPPRRPVRGIDAPELLRDLARVRPRGRRRRYSNFGAALLGQALAARLGAPYEDLVHERVLGPLGVDEVWARARPPVATAARPPRPPGRARGRWAPMRPAGCLRGTAAGALALSRPAWPPPEPMAAAVALALAPRERRGPMQTGSGWMRSPAGRAGMWWHNGGTADRARSPASSPEGGVAVAAVDERAEEPGSRGGPGLAGR